jgi:isoleucyl-tRNA synthetase
MYQLLDMKEKSSDLDKRVTKNWEENGIPEKSISFREGAKKFVFYEGPPTANGKPGIHHVMARTLKDSVCRYKTMQGYQVKRKAGWDTHGLPVEIEVEKKLNLHDKKSILNYGMENFCIQCKDSVFSYEKLWREMTKQMGYWIDLDHPYVTLDNEYIESVWWILSEFYKKNLIYKGHKIIPYCPSCGTPLSSHELAQGYKETEDPSVFIKFQTVEDSNTYFLAWTTTPWTLISNVALVVNPTEKYVKIKLKDDFLILAKSRLEIIKDDYTIIEEYLGKDLEYKEYHQLFSFVKPNKKGFYVACADYVTMDDGTGVVHTAPAFGQDDYQLGLKYNLPVINPVDDAGKFTEEITDWAGIFVKEADKSIIKKLKDMNVLFRREQIKHTYPFCWRCHSPLIYYAKSTWFVKTSQFKQQMLENNKTVNWHPSFVGEKRFGEWLENNVDWAISRNRFWGTPLNIWVCDNKHCDEKTSIGSIEELKAKGKMKSGEKVPDNIELHRPYVDDIELVCPKCGSKMHRTEEVLDCWFDSGSMPFAQLHYPFENIEVFEENFPADFISEGIDQTRGWFYTLLAISTMLKGKAPYKNVLVNDLILDKKGQKMSKSKGNTLDPIELMNQYGSDVIRWYMLYVSPPWTPTKFAVDGLKETTSKFLVTLKNVYSFYATYANIDNFDGGEYDENKEMTSEIDKWILSRLNTVIEKVTKYNDDYDFTKTVRLLQSFILDDVSNWYVRRSRRRFWSFELTEDKIDAYLTLKKVMVTYLKLIAPFAPFVADDLYVKLTGEESVHLTEFPKSDKNSIIESLEEEMKMIIASVSLGRAARNKCQIKVRQTLQALYLPEKMKPLVERMSELIKEEVNIVEIKYIQSQSNFVNYSVKPNFKVMGPKYGKHMRNISTAINSINANDFVADLRDKGVVYLEVDGSTFGIIEEDLIISISEKEGFVFETNNDLFVALDTNLTEELLDEGLARELVNKIQFTRRENNFEIMDRINIYYVADDHIEKIFKEKSNYIKSETLTDLISRIDYPKDDMKKWDINGKEVFLALHKVQ